MHPLQLTTSCQGPLVLNDNAFELCREFIRPEGARFFQQVSRYGDYLAEVAKTPDFNPGDVFKWILPFLKARGLTNEQASAFALKSLRLTPGASAAFRFLGAQDFPIFALSAAYRQFAAVVGQKFGFSVNNIYCTELDLDRHHPSQAEKEELLRLQEEILAAPEITLPAAAAPADLPGPVQEAIQVCDRVLKERVPQLEIGALCREVIPLSGPDKAKALEDSLSRTNLTMQDVLYVGDSRSDVKAFEAVLTGGGLAVSFNGDRAAVLAATVSIIADNAWPIALLASVFRLWGKEGVMELADKGAAGASRYLVLPEAVIDTLMQGLRGRNFNLRSTASQSPEITVKESLAMRGRLRTAAGLE